MEKLDRRILSLLARDGRMSYTDIGKETGLSTSAAQQRVRRLEQRGVIKGYTAILDATELGLLVTAFVAIKPFDPSQPDDAPERLQHIEEIVSCYSVAGEASYLLKVQAPTMATSGIHAGPHPSSRLKCPRTPRRSSRFPSRTALRSDQNAHLGLTRDLRRGTRLRSWPPRGDCCRDRRRSDQLRRQR